MKLFIKNMVCLCCSVYVGELLRSLGISHDVVSLGDVTLHDEPSPSQLNTLNDRLRQAGLEIVWEKKNLIVEKTKSMIRKLVNKDHDPLKMNLSAHLSEELNYNYSYLSNLFSELEGQTIRDYVIALRIDRVKQMLATDQLDLLEIAIRLNYSSPSHLAAQFKKVTGLTTTEFKKLNIPIGLPREMMG